ALDNFPIVDLAASNANLRRVLLDHGVHSGVGSRRTVARPVVIPTGAGFLSEAAHLAQPVRELAFIRAMPLGGTPLPDRPTDIVTGQIADPERPHGEPELLHRTVDLLGQTAFLEEEIGLGGIPVQHAVTDEAVTH